MHSHNCDEQVMVLDGSGEVDIAGLVTSLGQYDSTYIVAGDVHAFRNTGDRPMMILWIYSSAHVTRTFAATGETVAHLTENDRMIPSPPSGGI
jgi:mannose-6-phosphate isomerase-like protein (cupin superfamily)